MSTPLVDENRPTKRLAGSTSPYLLQHASNPVDWYPWGDEALSRARGEDKPIFLSIGYSSCHWCHVMAHESFEDATVAALLNESFVSIKVDREERPDLDDVYMTATLAMNRGQGGWPMSVFLTPDRKPFFAGTYFPPEDRWGRPGFRTLLRRIADAWKSERASIVGEAEHVTEFLSSQRGLLVGGSVGEEVLSRALAQLEEDYDARHGGFGGAPKFPPATTIELLLRVWKRGESARALEMARFTLEAMARGGIQDHIGGGFHRYATDERWLVPHFEKMLYDNALLAKAYLEGFQATGEELFRQVSAATLDYVLREMTSPEGGFYSATDADSEGEEGKYFVWTPAEVAALLGQPDARRVCAYFDITEAGNWEGQSIPNRVDPEAVVAWRLGEPLEAILESVTAGRPRLLEARARRKAPALDDKILTAWNGLMIGALARGAWVLADERYLDAGIRAADFILTQLRGTDGHLRRTWRLGRTGAPAFLEDYADLAEGLVDLYEAGASRRYLDRALALGEETLQQFAGEDGALLSTAEHHERLIVRPREGHDGATPSANATAAHVLVRLSYHFDRPDLREAARRAIEAHGQAIARQPRAFAKSLLVLDLLGSAPDEVALVGLPGSADYEELRREVGRFFLPRLVMAHSEGPPESSELPLLKARRSVDGRAALYVCRSAVCLPPIVSATEVKAALER